MQIQFTKSITRKIFAGLSVALFIVFLVTRHRMDIARPTVLVVWGALAICGLLAASFLWELKFSPAFQRIGAVLIFLVAPFISLKTVEILQQSNVVFGSTVYFLNLIIYFIIFIVLLILTNRVRMSVIIGSLLFFFIGLVNYFMIALRNAPLLPWDILAAHTAFNVLPGIKVIITEPIVVSTALALLMCAFSMQISYHVSGFHRRLVFSGIEIIVAISLFAVTCRFVDPSINLYNTDVWSVVHASQQNGFVDNFILNLRTLNNPAPDGYSKEKITKIVEDAVDNYHETNVGSSKKPNIIVIMNESFADLNVLGNLNLSEDVMPFIHSLKDNTVSGNLVVPVFGGGTCNTEYEFLTGNSSFMLRAGSYPMQQFVTSESPSLATTLKQQGYSAIGMHPYYGSGWNRNRAYPFLGFDKFITIDDFKNPQKVRGFVTDEADYQKIIEEYKNKDSKPMFLFNVTIQNHGGYAINDPNLNENITFPQSEKYRTSKQYYALAKKSDEAIKDLVTYFKNQSNPTIIVFFGDHQPALDENYYKTIPTGTKASEMQEAVNKHTVPFFVWANYDIKAENIGTISVNYLQNILLKTAGLSMTSYNKYLDTLYEKLPVLSTTVCMDKKGNYYNYLDSKMPYASLVSNYHLVQYNQVFDVSGRNDNLFYLAPER